MALTSVVLPTPGPPVMTSARRGDRLLERLALAGRKLLAGLALAPLDRLVEINRRIRGRHAAQILDPGGDAFLGPFQRGQEDEFLIVDLLRHEVAVGVRLLQGRSDDLLVHEQELAGLVLQELHRQGAMAVAGRFQQHMAQAGAGPDQRVVRDADLLGNLVGGLEADAVNVLGQRIRVGLHLGNGILAVGLVDANRPAGADALAVQEHHDLADDFLFRPRILDALPPLGADAVHILQPGGLRFDDVEDLLAELGHQLLGVDRADALDHAAAQIFLDAFLRRRRGAVQHLRLELEAELPVLNPASFGGHPLTGTDGGERADHRHLVAMALGFDLEHRPAVLLVEERDALDQPRKAFGKLLGGRLGLGRRHGGQFIAPRVRGDAYPSASICSPGEIAKICGENQKQDDGRLVAVTAAHSSVGR